MSQERQEVVVDRCVDQLQQTVYDEQDHIRAAAGTEIHMDVFRALIHL